MIRANCLFTLMLLSSCLTVAMAETRWHQYSKAFGSPSNGAEILCSSHLGGSGTEWLVGGGIHSDGRAVLVGSSLGPKLELPGGVPVSVLGGKDGKAPAFTRKPQLDRKGRPKKDKKGNPVLEPIGWQHANNTAFAVVLDKDLKKITKAVRFPWLAGGCTSALLDEEGHCYITGLAGANIGLLGKAEQLSGEGSKKIFLAKLKPDLSGVTWLKVIADTGVSPELRLTTEGQITVTAGSYHVFTTDGKREVVVPLGKRGRAFAVNPVDNSWARGGDTNTSTGREPWRRPYLGIYESTGEQRWDLFTWSSKLVGTDQFRLVSDSSVRVLRYSDDGKYLWIIGWSDGGNSVMNFQPYDMRKAIEHKGLGFSAWGAGVLSVCYVLRMNVETCHIENRTVWLAYLKSQNKPNGLGITTLGVAPDGSLLCGGGSASGLIMTGNHLYEGKDNKEWAPGGNYVTIFNKKLTGIRFSTVVSATGEASLRHDRERWGIVSGKVGNKQRVLFLSSSTSAKQTKYDLGPLKTPVRNPIQEEFGGGGCDGYLLAVEMQEDK